MKQAGVREATELLMALGTAPTKDHVSTVLAWERAQHAEIRKRADELAWLVEQHQNMLDMLMSELASPPAKPGAPEGKAT